MPMLTVQEYISNGECMCHLHVSNNFILRILWVGTNSDTEDSIRKHLFFLDNVGWPYLNRWKGPGLNILINENNPSLLSEALF